MLYTEHTHWYTFLPSLLSYGLAAINQQPIVVYWEKERDEDKEIVTSLERAFDVRTLYSRCHKRCKQL